MMTAHETDSIRYPLSIRMGVCISGISSATLVHAYFGTLTAIAARVTDRLAKEIRREELD